MVLQAFFDDSGSEPSSGHFVIAGYAASAESWAEFSNAWKELLDQSPPLEYFKMSEAWSMRGQFSHPGWTSELRDERVSALIALIPKYAQLRVGASIKYQDWLDLAKPLVAVQRTLNTDTPYGHLAWNVVSLLMLMAKHDNLPKDCQFTFDRQIGFNEDLLMQWKLFKRSAEIDGVSAWMPPYPIFQDETKYLPLQAADIYAWLIRRCLIPIEAVDTRILQWLKTSESVIGGKVHTTRANLRRLVGGYRTVKEDFMRERPQDMLYPPDIKARKASRKARKKANLSLEDESKDESH